MSWHVDVEVQPDNTVHVWPENDTIDHDLQRACICGPGLEEQTSGRILVTHHAIDAREDDEPR